jgi:hypothetical protein
MRIRRSAVLLVAVALTTTGPAAWSATKTKPKPPKAKPKPPVCNLVTDIPGDASPLNNGVSQAYAPSLDILSADVASNGKVITAVIRVKALTKSEQNSPFGRQWELTAKDGNSSLGFDVYDGPFGTFFSAGTGVLDYAHNEVRISVPVKDITLPLTPGTVLTGFSVSTSTVVEFDPAATLGNAFAPPGGSEDSATAPATVKYMVGALSCVKPGQ